MGNIQIKVAEKSSLEVLSNYEQELFTTEAYSESQLVSMLVDSAYIILMAYSGNNCAGYCICNINAVDKSAELFKIAIIERLRENGIATKLFAKLTSTLAIQGIESIYLEVRESNIPAICFYKRQGFNLDRIRESYYQFPNEDALIFSKRVRWLL